MKKLIYSMLLITSITTQALIAEDNFQLENNPNIGYFIKVGSVKLTHKKESKEDPYYNNQLKINFTNYIHKLNNRKSIEFTDYGMVTNGKLIPNKFKETIEATYGKSTVEFEFLKEKNKIEKSMTIITFDENKTKSKETQTLIDLKYQNNDFFTALKEDIIKAGSTRYIGDYKLLDISISRTGNRIMFAIIDDGLVYIVRLKKVSDKYGVTMYKGPIWLAKGSLL